MTISIWAFSILLGLNAMVLAWGAFRKKAGLGSILDQGITSGSTIYPIALDETKYKKAV